MNSKVTVVILNWNGWEDTIECLESLFQVNYPNYDVIVVDNDSDDVSVEKIKEYCEGKINVKSKLFKYNPNNKPIKICEYNENDLKTSQKGEKNDFNIHSNHKLILIKNNANYGFAGGNNIGIKYALKSLNSDYVLLLNNDTVVDRDFLTELVEVAESSPEIGFVGAKTYFYDMENTIQAAGGGKIDLKQAIALEIASNQIDNGKYDENGELDYVSGSCMLCKRKMLDKIGMLNEKYFMYWEDVDWCFRGKNIGYKSVYAFKSKIWHKAGVSSLNPLKIHYYTRNRIYFMKQNISRANYLKFLLYFFVYIFIPESAGFFNHDFSEFRSYLNGFISGLRLR